MSEFQSPMLPQQPTEEFVEKRGQNIVYKREIKHERFGMQLVADTIIRPDGSEGE